jgi:hypothetical protein
LVTIKEGQGISKSSLQGITNLSKQVSLNTEK